MAGRPIKYRSEYADQAFKFCLLGADDTRLAELFDVSERTLNYWKKQYPDFLQSVKAGKDQADAKVADSLYNRALGYSHPDVDVKVIDGKIVKTDLVKHYPPDATAIIFWLKNRQKDRWRDKSEVENEHTGTVIHVYRPEKLASNFDGTNAK